MTNRIQADLPLKIMHISLINWNTLKNCYSVFRIDLFEKLKACDFRFFLSVQLKRQCFKCSESVYQ